MRGRVLVVAGSDSGGGAGVQADIKTITMLGGYAMTAITALTAQDTRGVHGVLPIAVDFIRQQMRLSLADIGAEVIKTGMLHDAEVIAGVAAEIAATSPRPLIVVDPVMVAKGGASLLLDAGKQSLIEQLVPLCDLLTPNAPEAEALSGLGISDEASMIAAGSALVARGARAVLVKGGHLAGDVVTDALVTSDGATQLFRHARIASRSTHGTGCTLASALAVSLAQGMSLVQAVERARDYVARAIATAPGYGQGHGPIDHGWPLGRSR